MHRFRFALSLRAGHPQMRASEIESGLSLKPRVSNTVGEPRRTPIGEPLDGINKITFCAFDLAKGDDEHLLEELARWNGKFLERKAFFVEFVASGGEMEYFLGIFLEGNSGFGLSPKDMRDMQKLGITLSLDIYP